MLLSFATKAGIYPRGTRKHQGNSFISMNWSDSDFPRNKLPFQPKWQLSRPSCKCRVTQKLRNFKSTVSYHKTKNAFEALVSIFWWRHVKTNKELTYIRNYWLVYVTRTVQYPVGVWVQGVFLKKKTPIVSSLKFDWLQKMLFGKLRMFSLFKKHWI